MITVKQDTADLERAINQAQVSDRVNSLPFAVDVIRLELKASGPADELHLCRVLTIQANPNHLTAALAVLMLAGEVEQIEENADSYYQIA